MPFAVRRGAKIFFGATAQPHTIRTTPQVGQKWRHLGRRGARGRAQQAVERPSIAPTASTFRPFRPVLAVEDGWTRRTARRATGKRPARPTGRTERTASDRQARKSIFGYRYFFIYLRQEASVLVFDTFAKCVNFDAVSGSISRPIVS